MLSRTRWKLLAALAVVLVAGAAAACLMIRSGKAQERKELRCDLDPVTGCRYRFTVSSDWQITMPTIGAHSKSPLGSLSLTASPPPPFLQWMNDHLLRQSSSKPPTIQTFSYNLTPRALALKVANGYPVNRQSPQSRTLEYRHLRIDGYPATMSRWETANGGKNYQITFLRVYFPESSAMYDMFSSSESPNADQAYREIERIVSSFQIEKVADPVPDRR